MRAEGGSWAASPATRKSMQGNRRTDTGLELRFRSLLHRRGLRFRKDHLVRADGRPVRPDVVFPRARVVVFVDGCFWHGCVVHKSLPKTNTDFWATKIAKNVARDREVDRALSSAGWLVLRVWEHDNLERACDVVEREVRGRTDDALSLGCVGGAMRGAGVMRACGGARPGGSRDPAE
jgi:DNA mismatch endonuclease, patch repair protein